MGPPGRAFSSLESYLKHSRFQVSPYRFQGKRPLTFKLETLNLILVCLHDWQIKENA